MTEDSIPEDFVISEDQFNILLLENCPAKRTNNQKAAAAALGMIDEKPRTVQDEIQDLIEAKKEEYGFYLD